MKGAFAVTRDAVRAGEPVALASVIEIIPVDGVTTNYLLGAAMAVRPGHDVVGTLGGEGLDRIVADDALASLESGRSSVRHYGKREALSVEATVYIEVFRAPQRMVIFGAVDFTAALVRAAVNLGYYVVVCDAREVFASPLRFPEAHEVIVDWPHRYLARYGRTLGPRDAICVLTHDQKFDIPALVGALGTRVGYVGAMGSRRTNAERLEHLRAEGVGDEALARIMAPIGLDIGARTPEETAVAILAEIIGLQSGTTVPSLRNGSGRIHRANS